MDFSTVKDITIPEGSVKELAINGITVWKKMPDYLYFTAVDNTSISFDPKTDQFALPLVYYSLDGKTWTKYVFGTKISLSSGEKCYWKGDNDFWGRQFIPSNYTPITYIKCAQNRMLNTKYYPCVDTRLEIDFRLTATGAGSMAGCTNSTSGMISFDLRIANSGGRYSFMCSSTEVNTGIYRDTVRTYMTLGDGKFTYHDVDLIADTEIEAIASGTRSSTPLYLFTRNVNGTPSTNYTKFMELYACRIYEAGELVRDYIPCKNPSNVVGLYDFANGTFTKANSGTFTAGANIGYRENEIVFSSTGRVKAGGNVMSLIDSTMQTKMIPSTYCFYKMFNNCTTLMSLPKFPATTLKDNCYQDMFNGCSGIKMSSTKTGNYQKPFRIPDSGTGTSGTNSLTNMFGNTGGSFTGTPVINTTYYTE